MSQDGDGFIVLEIDLSLLSIPGPTHRLNLRTTSIIEQPAPTKAPRATITRQNRLCSRRSHQRSRLIQLEALRTVLPQFHLMPLGVRFKRGHYRSPPREPRTKVCGGGGF